MGNPVPPKGCCPGTICPATPTGVTIGTLDGTAWFHVIKGAEGLEVPMLSPLPTSKVPPVDRMPLELMLTFPLRGTYKSTILISMPCNQAPENKDKICLLPVKPGTFVVAVVDSAEVEQASAEMKVLHLSGVGRLVAGRIKYAKHYCSFRRNFSQEKPQDINFHIK